MICPATTATCPNNCAGACAYLEYRQTFDCYYHDDDPPEPINDEPPINDLTASGAGTI